MPSAVLRLVLWVHGYYLPVVEIKAYHAVRVCRGNRVYDYLGNRPVTNIFGVRLTGEHLPFGLGQKDIFTLVGDGIGGGKII